MQTRALLVLTALVVALPAAGQERTPHPSLELGPHPVGFRSWWELDAGRAYRTRFDDGRTYGGAEGAPRPVLVDLWYPADPSASAGARMPHVEYLALGHGPPALDAFAAALASYAREVLALELTGADSLPLADDADAVLTEFLARPTTCRRDAAPAPGKFPLVVHHSGAGSSFEDNASFCEYLASHGFVVAGSAYPDAAGEELGVDADEGSLRDLELLVRVATSLTFVDAKRIAGIGHSLGAQAMLRWGARPDCAADALVLLDTTVDYYARAVPIHDALERAVVAGLPYASQPLLVASGPGASFELLDSLVNAERTYLVVPELDHNEFIAQGLQRLAVLEALGEPSARAPRVRALYAELCDAVRRFLDAELRGERAPWGARRDAWAKTPLGGDSPRVEHVPVGASGPPPYDPAGEQPPTPRQLLRLLRESGAPATRAALERFVDHVPRSPVYDSSMFLGSLVCDLVERGDLEGARAMHAYLEELRPGYVGVFRFLADFSRQVGRTDEARRYLRLVLLLDPDDEVAAAQLEALGEN